MIRETRNHLVFLWLYFEILFSVAESRWGVENRLPHSCFFQSPVIFSTYLRQNCERRETCLARKRKMQSSVFPFWCILQSTSAPSQQCGGGLRVEDTSDSLTHLCWAGRVPALRISERPHALKVSAWWDRSSLCLFNSDPEAQSPSVMSYSVWEKGLCQAVHHLQILCWGQPRGKMLDFHLG